MRNWFSSDFHWGHSNILKMCNRDFVDIIEHDRAIIENHNSLVAENDISWNLGDIAYRCSPDYVAKKLACLNGKIMIVMGNHDKPLRQAYEMGFLNKMLNSGKIEIIGGEMAIKDHTLYIAKTIEINGQRIFISHMAHKTWINSFRGSWSLHGHSHSKIISVYKSIDVGVDAVPNKFFPISFEEIKDIMNIKNQDFSETE